MPDVEVGGVVVVVAEGFADAAQVGNAVMADRAVLIDLRDTDGALARRFVDFAAGLSYGLRARAEMFEEHMVLITPAGQEVDADQRDRLADYAAEGVGGAVDA